ncbi:ABC transporter permease [Mycobacterium sp. NAZ190054]|uniref:ABC transporter permease n=1 Tax=Mycobacterium sp. NAZ190054 TaxID=1747766 RepID=UPI0007929E6C|nr:ABC transporter permease [Mycobacterium sp. NAZ190054]KWX57144.1 hypothetical protein ASJ79_12360 [Mycobacterium sp. NAZ190054]
MNLTPAQRRRWLPRIVGAAALLVGFGAWEAYAAMQPTALFIPRFSAVVRSLFAQMGTAEFWNAYGQTLVPFVYGWTSALVVGVTLGLLIGTSPLLHSLTTPYFAFFNSVPLSTFLPILVIAFGLGLLSRSLVVFLFAVIDVVFTTAAGAAYVDRDLVMMAKSFKMGRAKRFRKVILPSAMPSIVSAIRLGTGRAVLGMVVMELLLVSVGVGRLVSSYRDGFQSAELYAILMSVAIFGLILLGAVRQIERRAHRGRPTAFGVNS